MSTPVKIDAISFAQAIIYRLFSMAHPHCQYVGRAGGIWPSGSRWDDQWPVASVSLDDRLARGTRWLSSNSLMNPDGRAL